MTRKRPKGSRESKRTFFLPQRSTSIFDGTACHTTVHTSAYDFAAAAAAFASLAAFLAAAAAAASYTAKNKHKIVQQYAAAMKNMTTETDEQQNGNAQQATQSPGIRAPQYGINRIKIEPRLPPTKQKQIERGCKNSGQDWLVQKWGW